MKIEDFEKDLTLHGKEIYSNVCPSRATLKKFYKWYNSLEKHLYSAEEYYREKDMNFALWNTLNQNNLLEFPFTSYVRLASYVLLYLAHKNIFIKDLGTLTAIMYILDNPKKNKKTITGCLYRTENPLKESLLFFKVSDFVERYSFSGKNMDLVNKFWKLDSNGLKFAGTKREEWILIDYIKEHISDSDPELNKLNTLIDDSVEKCKRLDDLIQKKKQSKTRGNFVYKRNRRKIF